MPLSGGLVAAAAGGVAVVVGGVAAVIIGRAHSRVETNADAVDETLSRHRKTLSLPLGSAPDSVEQFHRETMAQNNILQTKTNSKWPSKVHTEHLTRLASHLDKETAHARSCVRWSCGSWKSLGAGNLCRDAQAAVALLSSKGPLLKDLAAFANAQSASLAGQDVKRRFVLPPTATFLGPSLDVLELARERAAPSGSATPLSDLQSTLSSVISDGNTALAAQAASGAAPLACDDAFRTGLEQHSAALRALNAQPELVSERQGAELRASAKRSAVAAEVMAVAATKTLRAEEERRDHERVRAAAAGSCRDAIRGLTAALSALPQPPGRALPNDQRVPGRGLPTPQDITDCRNWQNEDEPITLEPIRNYSPADLVLLPCGKCMLSENVDRLRAPIDPFTGVPLPPVVRRPASVLGQVTNNHHGAVESLIRKAEQACRA